MHRQVSVTVARLQLDNQFDAHTPFPVVISLAPPDSPAFKLDLVEKLGQAGLSSYFNHVAFNVGPPLGRARPLSSMPRALPVCLSLCGPSIYICARLCACVYVDVCVTFVSLLCLCLCLCRYRLPPCR